MSLTMQLTLLRKKKIAKSAWELTFQRPEDFSFQAGQYVRIFDPVKKGNIFRDFSFSSSPSDKSRLAIVAKEGISEYKNNFFSLSVNKSFLIEAPLGRFIFESEEKNEHVFLAGGIGITPFCSMVRFAQSEKKYSHITLIASFASEEDSIYFNELSSLQQKAKNIQVIYTFTQKYDEIHEQGRISEKLLQKYIDDFRTKKFWISGSPSFVSDMEELLTSLGVSLSQLRTEIFLGF